MIKINIKAKFNNMINRLRRKQTYHYSGNSSTVFYRKQINRILICIIIILIVLVMKRINVKLTNNVIRIVDNSINYSYDIHEDTRKVIDFVKNIVKIPDKVVQTFSTEAGQ